MFKDQDYSFKEYKEKIIPIIKEKRGVIIPTDIALKTNYPLIHIKYTLNKLAAEYHADIAPTENGDLIYTFDPNLTNLSKNMTKWFKVFKKWFLQTMKKLFKISIMLMLVGYMVFYLLVIVGLAVAATSSDNDSDFDVGGLVGGAFRLIFEMLYYSFLFRDPYRHSFGRSGKPKKRAFYIRVFSFVFGDDEKEPPVDHEGNILRYLKMYKQITFSEALNITGESEEFIKDLLVNMTVKYEGDIEVDDDGIIIYVFEDLNFSDDNHERISYIWSRGREKKIPKLNYNTKGENGWIIAFNLFNLVMSVIATFFISTGSVMIDGQPVEIALPIWITIIPLTFSFLFFAIPLFRSFSLKRLIPKIKVYNDFAKEMLKVKRLKNRNSHIPIESMNKETAKYFYENYQEIFTYDFKENQEILDATGYHNELISE